MRWMVTPVLLAWALAACTGSPPSTGPGDAGVVDDAGATGSSSSGGSSSSSSGAPAPLVVTPVTSLWIEPSAGNGFLTSAINSASSTLDVAAYILTDNDVEQVIGNARARGVAVRVLLDPDQAANASARNYLQGRGVTVKNAPARFVNFHQKTVVVDNARAYIMTLNPSFAGFNDNREYAVRVEQAQEVADMKALFDSDWDNTANPNVTGTLVVSPNNSRARLLDLVNRAQTEILVSMEVFADEGMRLALKNRMDLGVDVKVLLAHPTDVTQNQADAEEMRNRGFQVRFLRNPTLHAKLVVVDAVAAYTGSVNFTRTSMDQNREIGVIVDDTTVVGPLHAQALADWNAGVSQ
ncbi:MAG: hypothetical protein HY904_01095 [Deltaproteobacteria bacterium]|nr:hypothetical protein [Deltaproteobacteria bacterium]